MTDVIKYVRLPELITKYLGCEIHRLLKIDSTNDYLKEHASVFAHGTVCYTDHQTAGKGRMGKVWSDGRQAAPNGSRSGKMIACSILLKTGIPPSSLPICCGIGTVNALSALTGGSFSIKWPNDIICNSSKICGILCENRIISGGQAFICGIGINLYQTAGELKKAGLPHAISLLMATDKIYTEEEVLTALLNHLEPIFDKAAQKGIAAVLPAYSGHCITLGKQVSVTENGISRQGLALSIRDDGALMVDFGDGIRAILAGEASVRGLLGYI